MMEKIFESTTGDILRILASAIAVYFLIILYIRLLGKRSTSELNNFDWIVTVSVGSIIASTVILEDISVTEGGFSVFVLMVLQYIITKTMLKSQKLKHTIKSTPKLLFFEGKFIEENMRKERILESEVYASIRLKGLKSIKQIYAVVLETNSKISVIPDDNSGKIGFSLHGVHGLPEGLENDLKIQVEKISSTTDKSY